MRNAVLQNATCNIRTFWFNNSQRPDIIYQSATLGKEIIITLIIDEFTTESSAQPKKKKKKKTAKLNMSKQANLQLPLWVS